MTQPSWWVGVVDDDGSVRRALARLLHQHDIPVESFASAEDFLGRAVGGEPCCLVLDVHLGGLTGFELQDHLASRGVAIPIIFITGHDEIGARTLACRAGQCGFLRKPFQSDALLSLVSQHLPNVALEH